MEQPQVISPSFKLRPGYHLFPHDNGSWLLATPTDQFFRIHLPFDQLTRFAASLAGEVVEFDEDVHNCLLQQFQTHQIITAIEGKIAPPTIQHVIVQGDNPIARSVASLLQESGLMISRQEDDALPSEQAELVISCAGWLPDQSWRKLSQYCREQGLPWQRCYMEGQRFYIGPLFLPERTASYEDERARRLAASSFPEELRSYWRYLAQGKHIPPVPWPDAASTAILSGLLLADVFAYRDGRDIPHREYQLSYALDTHTLARHPLLPIPSGFQEEPVL